MDCVIILVCFWLRPNASEWLYAGITLQKLQHERAIPWFVPCLWLHWSPLLLEQLNRNIRKGGSIFPNLSLEPEFLHCQGLSLWLNGTRTVVHLIIHSTGPCLANPVALWKWANVLDLCITVTYNLAPVGTGRQMEGQKSRVAMEA